MKLRTIAFWGLATQSMHASAATTTATLDVSVTITAECSIVVSAIDFGTRGVLNAGFNATGNIALTCTKGTAYAIALGPGVNGASTSSRKMTNAAGSEFIDYGLYQNTARSVVWGDATADRVSGTSTGNLRNISIYAQIPVQASKPTGRYTDIVSVTVTY